MTAPTLATAFESWSQPSYNVRVRPVDPPNPPMFLWGSAGVTQDLTFFRPLVLHIRNDPFGEPVKVGTQASGTQTNIGTLQPGECVSIPMQGISGVFATCEIESTVSCLIKAST